MTQEEFEALPREKQRVEIIRERAQKVSQESPRKADLSNWIIAEGRLCKEYPEFRCAKVVYSALSQICHKALSEIADKDRLSEHATQQFELDTLISHIMSLSSRGGQPRIELSKDQTVGGLIKELVKIGF